MSLAVGEAWSDKLLQGIRCIHSGDRACTKLQLGSNRAGATPQRSRAPLGTASASSLPAYPLPRTALSAAAAAADDHPQHLQAYHPFLQLKRIASASENAGCCLQRHLRGTPPRPRCWRRATSRGTCSSSAARAWGAATMCCCWIWYPGSGPVRCSPAPLRRRGRAPRLLWLVR